MALDVVRGPAGGGKSQWIRNRLRAGMVVLDFTRIWAALSGAERGPDGKYPERTDGDPLLALVQAVKTYASREAARRGFDGFVTTSDSRPEEIDRLRDAGADGEVETIDPGLDAIRARLADPVTGRLSDECEKAIRRWYR